MGGGARAAADDVTAAVRPAQRSDLGAVVAIERASFGDPWTRGMFGTHLTSDGGNNFLVAEEAGSVVGYAIAVVVSEESELLNIAVDPDRRGRGFGALLLDAAMDLCRGSGATEMWLEVRASNAGARTLYDSRGFAEMGVRKRYYHAPREDAIVLRSDLRSVVRNKTVTEAVTGFLPDARDGILSSASHFPRQENQ
jgi:[ribosomal protein S18]-alanine N-acetyltransferase